MLGKLLKHEYKATFKIFLSLYAGMLLITVLTSLSNHLDVFDNKILGILQSLLNVGFGICCFALPIGTIIYILYRFYKNLFTDEGYLMFTLPVSRNQLIMSKFIVSCTWFVGSAGVLIGCGILYAIADSGFKAFTDFLGELLKEMINSSFKDSTFAVLFLIIFIVSYVVYTISFLYLAIAFGQLIIPKHKIIGAFLAYFILNMAQQLVSTVVLFCYAGFTDYSLTSEYLPNSYFLVFGLLQFALSVLWLFLTNVICTKKLNLS